MAHFAEIDETNTVLRVLVVHDDDEHRGQEFLADDLGFGGTWMQTSYNNSIRNRFAGVGFIYDPDNDVFYQPSPHPSWVLDENFEWQPPVVYPGDGGLYNWDEATTSWTEAEAS